MPLALTSSKRSAVLEPKMQLAYVGGPDMTDDIPNRDSADYRIDEANLFLLNRYQGYDYLRPEHAPTLEFPPLLRMRWWAKFRALWAPATGLQEKPRKVWPSMSETTVGYRGQPFGKS